MTTKGKQTTEKKHIHKWDDHCDCEYCTLEVCINCGQEREKRPYKKSL